MDDGFKGLPRTMVRVGANTITGGAASLPPLGLTNVAAATVPLTVKGAASQSADLQQWQNSVGTTLASMSASGYYFGGGLQSTGAVYASLDTKSPLTGQGLSARSLVASSVPFSVIGAASQSADLQQWQDSASHVQLAVTNRGSGGSPIWALKVRAVANAESMAQGHATLGAYSGKAIEVMDDAGASLGFIPLYA